MKKPYMICHMMMSVDGRIDCGMTVKIAGSNEYYETLNALNVPTTLSGRVTAQLEMSDSGVFEPTNAAVAFGKEDFSKNGMQWATRSSWIQRERSFGMMTATVARLWLSFCRKPSQRSILPISIRFIFRGSSAAKSGSTCAELLKFCILSLVWNAWQSLEAARSMQPSSMRGCWMRSVFCSVPESMADAA